MGGEEEGEGREWEKKRRAKEGRRKGVEEEEWTSKPVKNIHIPREHHNHATSHTHYTCVTSYCKYSYTTVPQASTSQSHCGQITPTPHLRTVPMGIWWVPLTVG